MTAQLTVGQPAKKSVRVLAILMAFFIAISSSISFAPSASADTGGYPYASYYGPGTNPSESTWTDSSGVWYSNYGYGYRNCTDYVAWKLQSLGVSDAKTRGLGHGYEWATKAQGRSGVTVNGTPAYGAAAVKTGGSYGHVAFVQSVNSNGTITVSEYNWSSPLTGNYGTRTGTASALGFVSFVHFGLNAPAPTPPFDGTLLQVENTGGAWAAYDISEAAEKKYTRGTPGVLWSATGPNVFAADTNGALRQFTTCSNGIGWCSYVILANGALGTGGVSVAHSGSAIEVFAVTQDGTLLQVENPGNGWSVYNISQAVGNVKIKGSPSVIWGPTGPNVFAIDTNGALRQFTLCPGGGWCKYTLTADNTFAGGVSATMNGSAIEVFARSAGNHLYQVEFTNGAWSVYDVTNFAEGVQIKGTPGVLWTSSGPSVYAADSNGALRQFAICSGGSSWCTFKILNDGALGDGAGVDVVHTGSAIEVFASTQ